MIHFGKACGSRTFFRSDSNLTHTSWKMSAASSRVRPYLIGTEKIRFLYFWTNSAHAFGSPSKHSRTNRTFSFGGDGRAVIEGLSIRLFISCPLSGLVPVVTSPAEPARRFRIVP